MMQFTVTITEHEEEVISIGFEVDGRKGTRLENETAHAITRVICQYSRMKAEEGHGGGEIIAKVENDTQAIEDLGKKLVEETIANARIKRAKEDL